MSSCRGDFRGGVLSGGKFFIGFSNITPRVINRINISGKQDICQFNILNGAQYIKYKILSLSGAGGISHEKMSGMKGIAVRRSIL